MTTTSGGMHSAMPSSPPVVVEADASADVASVTARWPWVVAGFVVLLGTAGVVVSYFVRWHPWWSSFLLNLGVAMFLAIPLFVVTSMLSRKIDASSKKLKDDIAELRTETDHKIESLAAAFDSRSTVLRWAEGGRVDDNLPSLEKIRTLLNSGAASSAGLIVPLLPSRNIFVELRISGGHLLATALDAAEIYSSKTTTPTLTTFRPLRIERSASLNHCAAQIIESLPSAGLRVPIDAFNPAEFESEVESTITDIAKSYRDYIDDEPGGMRVVVNAGWVVADEALLARSTHYYAPYDDGTNDDYGWRPHLLGKTWVDSYELNVAIRWAYSMGLVDATWAEGTIGYRDELWHPSMRLTNRSDLSVDPSVPGDY